MLLLIVRERRSIWITKAEHIYRREHEVNLQYDQAVEVYNELVATNIPKPPTLAAIKKTLTDKQRKYIEKHKAVMVITPPVPLYDLIKQFDKKQKEKTYIYHELWDKYDLGSDLRVDFVLPELMYTNQTYEQQREFLTKDRKSVKGLQSIDPRVYVTLNAIRRANGEGLLDKTTFTRFINLPMKRAGGRSWVSGANSSDGQLGLRGSNGGSCPSGGARLLVGLDISDFEISASSETSSFVQSSDIAKLLEAINRLNEKEGEVRELSLSIRKNTLAVNKLTALVQKTFYTRSYNDQDIPSTCNSALPYVLFR